MKLTSFIMHYSFIIDKAIKCIARNPDIVLDDEDRRRWIIQDEMMYNFAKSFGVDI